MSILGAGIATAIGGLIGTGIDTWQKYEDRKFNASEAQKQRDFEERMANTAVQRQVADAKAAGINPAMMYANSASSGAATPNGSSANSSSGAVTGSLSSVLNSAANLINSHTNQLRQDRESKHLDYKEREKLDYSTQRIYNSAGRLLTKIVNERASN